MNTTTNIIIILRLLILHIQFEGLFPDNRLYMATTSVTLLGFLVSAVLFSVAFAFLFRFIGFTNHFRLAMFPYSHHARFGIPNVPNLIRKARIRLGTNMKSQHKTEARKSRAVGK